MFVVVEDYNSIMTTHLAWPELLEDRVITVNPKETHYPLL